MARRRRQLDFEMSYKVPGPASRRFLESTVAIIAIMGPIGSGKTSACVWKIMLCAMMQAPSPIDNVRYSRWAIVRDTYENLKRTAMKTWLDWFPEELGDWANGPPAEHKIRIDHPSGDGTTIELHLLFQGVGDNNAEDLTRGWELTGAYLNEADRLDESVFKAVRKRCGRYPSKKHGGPSWYGVILDFNAPLEGNWCVRRFIEKRLPHHEFVEQPPGLIEEGDGTYRLNPAAENIENLPPGYYDNEVAEILADPEQTDPEQEIGRMILNRPGLPKNGMPVFKQYRDRVHYVDREIEPTPGLPLIIGADAGRTPAAIILQQQRGGQWIALEEVIGDQQVAGEFGEELMQVLEQRYAEFLPIHVLRRRGLMIGHNSRGAGMGGPMIRIFTDPASANGNDVVDDTWTELLALATGLPVQPAPGENVLSLRLGAVNGPLTRMVGGDPGLLITKRCPMVRKGMMGGYRYRKVNFAGTVKYMETPDKNEYSHPMDGLQYGLLGGGEYRKVIEQRRGREQRRHDGPVQAVMSNDRIGYV